MRRATSSCSHGETKGAVRCHRLTATGSSVGGCCVEVIRDAIGFAEKPANQMTLNLTRPQKCFDSESLRERETGILTQCSQACRCLIYPSSYLCPTSAYPTLLASAQFAVVGQRARYALLAWRALQSYNRAVAAAHCCCLLIFPGACEYRRVFAARAPNNRRRPTKRWLRFLMLIRGHHSLLATSLGARRAGLDFSRL